MRSILRYFGRQKKWLLMVEALAMVGTIGWLDYMTGWELSLFVLYAFPIFLVVWSADLPSGLFFAAFSALAWWIANQAVNPYMTPWGYPVATITRLAYFVFVAVGSAAIKAERRTDRERIEALERARDLERDIIRISEHEQRKIGQELHDDLCQELVAIGCAAAMLKDDLVLKALPEAAAADEIERMIGDSVGKTRDLARGIFPVQMEKNGLVVALGELVANLNRVHRANISLIAPDEIPVHDPRVGMHLYRISQEALSNAIRHGGASEIVVNLRNASGGLALEISDDGIGVAGRPDGPGMGLRTMQYRANMIGADLEIESVASGGTIVSCFVKAEGAPEDVDNG